MGSCPDTDIDPFAFINWVKLEFLRLTIHSEEASNSSIECHLSKEWLLLWCNCKKNTLILFSGCIKFMWTQHGVHSGYQDDLGKISCTCSCSFTLSLSTQEWQNVQKWMGGGGGGGELKVQFAQTLPQILSLVNLHSISIKLGNNWRSNFLDCTVFIKIMYNFPSELLVLWGANSQLKMAVYPLALASFWFSLTVQFTSCLWNWDKLQN